MKKRDLITLHRTLVSIEGRKSTVKFSYFIAKNKVMIKDDYNILEEAGKPSEEFTEYDAKRAKLAHELADRDEKKQPRIENGNFVIIENVDKFKKELDKLKKEYASVIKDQDKKFKEFNALLDEEIEYKPGPKIALQDIPEQVEPAVLEILIIADLIIDTEEN